MQVTANVLLNYIRCRRYAALNDPNTEYMSDDYSVGSKNYYTEYIDMFGNIFFDKVTHLEKNLHITHDFDKDIDLHEVYNYKVGDDLYCLIPTTSKDFLRLQFRQGKHRYQFFRKNKRNHYEMATPVDLDDLGNYNDKFKKLTTRTDDLGRIVYSYAFKQFLYNKYDSLSNAKVYIVMLNSNYVYDGIGYTKEMYHIFDFSKLYADFQEIINADIYRMINHISLNDFTPCMLVKKECNLNDTFECKFTDFCFNHIPKENSILNYFSSFRGFDEPTDFGLVHHDTYDLINEGHVDMKDVPIAWLKDELHLMQRYCADTDYVHVNVPKIEAILKSLRYPLIYLDFEALPCLLPRYKGESPYTQSVFQYSIHIELKENELDKDGFKHYEYIADPAYDSRRELVQNLIRICNSYDSSIIVYHKTFEKLRLQELQKVFPEYKKDLQKIINRIFDLKDVLKTNKKFYADLGLKISETGRYNFYHKKLSGSYSLKKVIKIFDKNAYEDLNIKNGVEAYKAFMRLENLQPTERDQTVSDLLEYCKQDTYSMYQIIQGLKKYLSPDFSIT